MWRHVFGNALIPIITGFPAAFVGAFFSSSLLIETLFSLDGLGLLRALAGEGSRPRIPVVMLTTSSERPELREACMELGASAWVLKLFPFDSRELRAAIAALLHPSEQAGRFA